MFAMSIAVAFRAFWVALIDADRSERIRLAIEQPPAVSDSQGDAAAAGRSSDTVVDLPRPTVAAPGPRPGAPGTPPGAKAASARSEAVTLLAMLQREARLVDLIEEPLDQFSDSQVGAAARPCLVQCRSTLQRAFDLRPLLEQAEGQMVDVPADASPLRYQWVGEAAGRSQRGRLVHPGWRASRCELASWTAAAADAEVIAPAQIEP